MSPRLQLAVIAITVAFAGACKSDPEKILSTSHLSNTHDRVGPYEVVAVITGEPGSVTLEYSFDRGATFHCLDMPEGVEDTYKVGIPGTQELGVQVRYFVRTSGNQFDPPGAGVSPPPCPVAGSGADGGGDAGMDGGTRADAGVGPDAGASRDEAYSFEVLPLEGDCRVDSDCVPSEICVEGTHDVCQLTQGSCSGTNQCAQGFNCDPVRQICLIDRRACTAQTGDAPCLSREVCDPSLGFCGPRALCDNGLCPTGFTCDRARDLCLRQ